MAKPNQLATTIAAARLPHRAKPCKTRRRAGNARNRQHQARLGAWLGGQRAGPGDDALQSSGRGAAAIGDRPRRGNITGRSRIGGELGGHPIAFLFVEQPVGEAGEIEEMRGLVRRGVTRPAASPQGAPPLEFFRVSGLFVGSAHRTRLFLRM